MHSELNGLASVVDLPPIVHTPTVIVDDWGLMMQAGYLGQLMNKHDFFHFLTFERQVILNGVHFDPPLCEAGDGLLLFRGDKGSPESITDQT